MELPFAVESPERVSGDSELHHSTAGSSLVTASSQGSLINSNLTGSPLLPNTPQDVVLPNYNNYQGNQQHQPHGHVSIPGQVLASAVAQGGSHHQHAHHPNPATEPDINDFTYVNVCESDADEVDILIGGGYVVKEPETRRGDVLTVLLSGTPQQDNEELVEETEETNKLASRASEAKKCGDLQTALEYHTQAARKYNDISLKVKQRNASLASSLQLLSQAQAKSALALKRIVKLSSSDLLKVMPPASSGNSGGSSTTTSNPPLSRKERLRAAVRGALGSHHPHEEDISDSIFLGKADATTISAANKTPHPLATTSSRANDQTAYEQHNEGGTLVSASQDSPHDSNPVDEMMELERELRDMDMALELGNSISSLDARMQNRMKNSIVEGSFMVVPPGSNSYMSSSMWGSGHIPANSNNLNAASSSANHRPPSVIGAGPAPNSGTAGVRARANRVQNVLGTSVTPANRAVPVQQHNPHSVLHPVVNTSAPRNTNPGLESSWWGNASTSASQVLASSVTSLGSRSGLIQLEGGGGGEHHHGHRASSQTANTKQVMRLMDSLKTLGEENAALLREVEDAEAARMEAKAAREEMKRFKNVYGKRFAALRAALDKFRKDHGGGGGSSNNPVNSSEYFRSASVTEQIQRQEQLIRKLTTDLKKEKEESKKKDAALRKYESFYREVKARSAQKAAQRQQQPKSRSRTSR